MNKKILNGKNKSYMKKNKDNTLQPKENIIKEKNRSYKSFSNFKYNMSNKSNEIKCENIYKTILNGSQKDLKTKEKKQILKKK